MGEKEREKDGDRGNVYDFKPHLLGLILVNQIEKAKEYGIQILNVFLQLPKWVSQFCKLPMKVVFFLDNSLK